ncbi:MAG: RHS repeat-associated core domain-containing protein [Caldilineales bacterium]|nr:RHS repeat-associated core domain-containing protein [Caldilineales bacterium]
MSYDEIEVSRFKKYYAAGGVRACPESGRRVAMWEPETVFFLLSDHPSASLRTGLGSTAMVADGNGAETGKLLYKPWGETRYSSGNTPTSFRYTGQREDASIGLYFYGARYEACPERSEGTPVLGRFIQADTIVPQPGNPGSLNRYSYARNNPIVFQDPSGHAPQYPGDPDPNNAPCSTEWCWKNRWYRAHGYTWDAGTNHWSTLTASIEFYDEGIAQEFFTEFEIELSGSWTLSQQTLVGQAMVDFYRKIGSAARLAQLIGGGNRFIRSGNGAGPCSVAHSACTLFSTIWFYDSLFAAEESFIKGTVVHEIAHIIDFNSVVPSHAARGAKDTWFSLSFGFPKMDTITAYGQSGRAEYWAEAVADWVYGTAYKGDESTRTRQAISALQTNLIDRWIGGR